MEQKENAEGQKLSPSKEFSYLSQSIVSFNAEIDPFYLSRWARMRAKVDKFE